MNNEGLNKPTLESKAEHTSWMVTFDASGNMKGLPEDVSNKDVLVFIGNDGKWYAQKPSPELLEEIRQWRTDWDDV